MPISFAIDVARRRILAELSGEISGPDLQRIQAEIAAYPDYSPDLDVVFDNRRITHLVDAPSRIFLTLARSSTASAKSRFIIVATRGGLRLLLRDDPMYHTQRTLVGPTGGVGVCETLEEAEELLAGNEPEAG